jgi:hypothetical protein
MDSRRLPESDAERAYAAAIKRLRGGQVKAEPIGDEPDSRRAQILTAGREALAPRRRRHRVPEADRQRALAVARKRLQLVQERREATEAEVRSTGRRLAGLTIALRRRPAITPVARTGRERRPSCNGRRPGSRRSTGDRGGPGDDPGESDPGDSDSHRRRGYGVAPAPAGLLGVLETAGTEAA